MSHYFRQFLPLPLNLVTHVTKEAINHYISADSGVNVFAPLAPVVQGEDPALPLLPSLRWRCDSPPSSGKAIPVCPVLVVTTGPGPEQS